MTSYWLESVEGERKRYNKLKESIEADVCIIGGGITGITIAYYLSKTNLKVVLLEKNGLYEHTTGNTTAKITSQHGLIYDYLIMSQGEEKARQYLRANEEAIQNIKDIIENEKINCELEEQNAYVFTQKESELEKIKKEVESANSLGIDAKFVTKVDLPINILGAIQFPNQAQFNPCKYLESILNIIDSKVSIYESTKVIDLKRENNRYNVITEDDNIINAKYVVLSSHYPIINIPGYYFLKMYQEMSYIIGIKIKQEKFKGMYINSETPTLSFRTTNYENDKLVLVGGMNNKTGVKQDLSSKYKYLEEAAKQIYPDSTLVYRWCTQDCITLDKIPYIGEFSKLMPNMYVATGYNKWGMTSSNVAANIIVNRILDKPNSYEDVFTSTRLEPIKNHKELYNMAKEVVNSEVIRKIKPTDDKVKQINKGEGSIVEIDGKKVGIYKDEKDNIFAIKPICTHLGCELEWNNLLKTWDCPCHGSRFNYKGESIYDPSIKNLEKIELEI